MQDEKTARSAGERRTESRGSIDAGRRPDRRGAGLSGDAGPMVGAADRPPALGVAPFPAALCDRLFAAVLIDDEVDPDACLPRTIALDYAPDALVSCFRLCRQLWYEGFDRDGLVGLTHTLLRERDLDAGDRLRFKHIRAKFKHFRYAHALYGAAHRYPRVLDRITITMGHLQDAYRNRRHGAVVREAAILRLLLTAPPVHWLRREADRLVMTEPAMFRRLLEGDFAALAALVARPQVTGHAFHAARKQVGRQVSFWDTLRTLEPTTDRYDMSRTLSAINGLMGDFHDGLVERRGSDPASYAADFALPEEIRDRIVQLLARVGRRG